MSDIILRYSCISGKLSVKDLACKQHFLSARLRAKNRHPFCSISHSNKLVVSISSDNPIGVDIEHRKNIEIEELYPTIFPINIWKRILSERAEKRIRIFYDYWTKLESVLKADGRGFSLPPETLVWDISRDLVFTDKDLWQTFNYELFTEYSCAVAVLASTPNKKKIIVEYD